MSLNYTPVVQDIENPIQNANNLTQIVDNSICKICSQTLVGTERYTACCNHVYHYHCVYSHLSHPNAECPQCKTKIKLNIVDPQANTTFLHEIFFGNFYTTLVYVYMFFTIPLYVYNICALFVAFVGIIKFKFEGLVLMYFILNLILGTIQTLSNWRILIALRQYYELHSRVERFGKRELKILHGVSTLFYTYMLIFGINICNSNLDGLQRVYFHVIFASSIFRLIFSLIKAIIYVFDLYVIFEKETKINVFYVDLNQF